MTKHEFLNRFSNELNRRGVADAEDIVEEYAQHFAFKQADGYSEEEIAAKLGVRRSWPHSLNSLPPSKASVAKKPPS